MILASWEAILNTVIIAIIGPLVILLVGAFFSLRKENRSQHAEVYDGLEFVQEHQQTTHALLMSLHERTGEIHADVQEVKKVAKSAADLAKHNSERLDSITNQSLKS